MASRYLDRLRVYKRGGASLLFLCALSVGVSAQEGVTDPAQLEFQAGVRAMFAGDQATAMARFERLFHQTGALRVKLEWARSAFLAKQYALSKRLFNEVLAEDIPDSVRFNIALSLAEIAKLGTKTDHGFTFVRDTNPFAVGKKQVIFIYGIPFNYQPARQQEKLNGLNFYVNHSRLLNDAGTVRLLADADNTEYDGGGNKSSVKLALELKHQSQDNLSWKLGVDHFYQHRDLLLRQPNLGVQYRKDQLTGWVNQYQLNLGLNKTDFPDFAYANGQTVSVAANVVKNIGNGLQIGGNVYFDEMTSGSRSLDHETVSGGVYARFFIPLVSSNVRLNLTHTRRTYRGLDELFIVKREDQRELVTAFVQPYAIKFLWLYPAVEFGLEKSKSNIPINSFERTFFNFTLRKDY